MYLSFAFCDNFSLYANDALRRYAARTGEINRDGVLADINAGKLVFAVANSGRRMVVVSRQTPSRRSTWCEGHPFIRQGTFPHE